MARTDDLSKLISGPELCWYSATAEWVARSSDRQPPCSQWKVFIEWSVSPIFTAPHKQGMQWTPFKAKGFNNHGWKNMKYLAGNWKHVYSYDYGEHFLSYQWVPQYRKDVPLNHKLSCCYLRLGHSLIAHCLSSILYLIF